MEIGFTMLDVKNSAQAENALLQIGCDPKGVQIMKAKAVFKVIKVTHVRAKAANLLKQTFLAKGAEAAVARGCADLSSEYTDVLLMATLKQYRQVIASLKMQPWGLSQIARQLESVLQCSEQIPERNFVCRSRVLRIDKNCNLIIADMDVAQAAYDAAIAAKQIKKMQSEGAQAIRLVTEGVYHRTSEKDELVKLLPFLQKVMSFSELPIMVQTNKLAVMKSSLEYGIDFIDIDGSFLEKPEVLYLLTQYKIPVIITFKRGNFLPSYKLMKEICLFLQKSISVGNREEIDAANIILAPYECFFENYEDNFRIIEEMKQLKALGCPLLMNFNAAAGKKPALRLSSRARDEMFLAALTLSKMNGAQLFCGSQISTFKNILDIVGRVGRVEKNDEDCN